MDREVYRDLKRRYTTYLAEREELSRSVIEAFEPRLFQAYNFISEASGTTSKAPWHRATDIITWLDCIHPRSIYELGSGRSSLIFSIWAARHDISHVAIEQRPGWCELTNQAIARVEGRGRAIHAPIMRVGDLGIRYTVDISDEPDLIYIDGPSSAGQKFATPNQRPICYDVPHYLAKGGRPRAIIVDGRENTCNHLLTLPDVREYSVQLQFRLRREGEPVAEFPRHTILLLNPSAETTRCRESLTTAKSAL